MSYRQTDVHHQDRLSGSKVGILYDFQKQGRIQPEVTYILSRVLLLQLAQHQGLPPPRQCVSKSEVSMSPLQLHVTLVKKDLTPFALHGSF